jgi:hypothetical protein
MTEIEARIVDLINFSSNHKPVEFGDAFKSIMNSKITDAIEVRKQEIAQTMFNPPSNDEVEVESDEELELDNEEQEEEDLEYAEST